VGGKERRNWGMTFGKELERRPGVFHSCLGAEQGKSTSSRAEGLLKTGRGRKASKGGSVTEDETGDSIKRSAAASSCDLSSKRTEGEWEQNLERGGNAEKEKKGSGGSDILPNGRAGRRRVVEGPRLHSSAKREGNNSMKSAFGEKEKKGTRKVAQGRTVREESLEKAINLARTGGSSRFVCRNGGRERTRTFAHAAGKRKR